MSSQHLGEIMGDPRICRFAPDIKRWYIIRNNFKEGGYASEFLWVNLTWHNECDWDNWGGYYKTRGLAKATLNKWERTIP